MKNDTIFQMISNQDIEGISKDNDLKNNVNQLHEDRCEYSYSTFLLHAIDVGWIEGTRFFIEIGADLHLCLPWEPLPLGLAVEKGDFEIVKLLLESGSNPNKGGVDNLPMHDAVGRERIDLLQLLIQSGAELNKRGHDDTTPLMVASYLGNLTIVEILIKAGACVHFTHESGETALEIAIKGGHKNVAEYLGSVVL
jgi:ankyrin repeat protein